MREDVDVEVLHDLDHEVQAVEERVDGDAQHPVGRGRVFHPQRLLLLLPLLLLFPLWPGIAAALRVVPDGGEGSADEGGQLLVHLQGLEGRRGESLRREGDCEDSVVVVIIVVSVVFISFRHVLM